MDRDYCELADCLSRVLLPGAGQSDRAQALMIHGGSSRNHADTWRGGRAQARD
jgi:hypothetical protein